MVESKSVGTLIPLQKQDIQKGLYVDRGVVSPKLGKSFSACSLTSGLNFGSSKVSIVCILN
jgi:6-phosphofructo-2-kinase/fructose-2,6-biphosphatase